MSVESTQHKLDRVRPPRVQITYDVEVGDAIVKKELPFVAGIMADLSGEPVEPLPQLKERKFVEIDRDNFNEVLASCKPRVELTVDNALTEEDTKMSVELTFENLDDFTPTAIVRQIPALDTLLQARTALSDLIAKLDGNTDLDALLQQVITNTSDKDALKEQLGE